MKINFRNFFKPKITTPPLDTARVQARFNEALALHQSGQLAQAREIYQSVLKMHPRHFDALHYLGVLAYQTKDHWVAVDSIRKAIALDPHKPYNAAAYNNLGLALQELKRLDEALSSYNQAIALNASIAEFHNNRGVTLKALKRLDEALASYDQAIQLKANYAEAYNNRGSTLWQLKRLDEALASYDQAINLKADFADAHYNRGITLDALMQLDKALASYDQAIMFKTDFADAHYNRGNTLRQLQRPDEALASYDQAIKLKTDFAEAHSNRGDILQGLSRLNEALASYNQAIMLKADSPATYNNRGELLIKLRQHEDAVQSFSRALEADPAYAFGEGQLLHAKMLCCDWHNLPELADAIKRGILIRKKSAEPFGYQAISYSEQDLRACAEIFAVDKFPVPDIPIRKTKIHRHDKIRIGYLSGEFREQATAVLMTGLWELHDKTRFEIYAFDNGWDDSSDRRARIKSAFDEIVDITRMSDVDAASLIKAKEIDILINLNGYFGKGRQGIFSHRASPVQVNYLGFPGTIGADYIDYLIADKIVIPEGSRQHYSEKIVYLPNSYQANDRKRQTADKTLSREAFGLPQTGFVFCCFNNNYKITPGTFDSWMRILKQVDGSVLWLLEDNTTAARNLRQESEARGVSTERLIFAKRLPLTEHLARHRTADLFIDTLPYNAHTTASDALWAGLPVLTCMGNTFAGRVAASLLNAIGLPELITRSEDQFESLAVALATHPDKLLQIKQKLERNRLTTPLFDTALFTQHIEVAYTQMVERYQADLPPAHFFV